MIIKPNLNSKHIHSFPSIDNTEKQTNTIVNVSTWEKEFSSYLYVWSGTGVWINAKVFNLHLNIVAFDCLHLIAVPVLKRCEANKVIIRLLFTFIEYKTLYLYIDFLSFVDPSASVIKRKNNSTNVFIYYSLDIESKMLGAEQSRLNEN